MANAVRTECKACIVADNRGNRLSEKENKMAVREVPFDQVKSMVGEVLTGDHQWIHVDVDRARQESPYGTTIAHGYYTLSLIPYLSSQIWKATGAKIGVNYGLNKLRFPSPVPVGKKVRAHAKLADVQDVEGGLQLQVTTTIEVEGSEKPACVAETVSRLYN